jgi:outer membrane protein TolC
VETLRLTQLAEQTRARSEQIDADLAEVEAQLADLQERRVAAEAALKSWTCSWPTARSARPNWATA